MNLNIILLITSNAFGEHDTLKNKEDEFSYINVSDYDYVLIYHDKGNDIINNLLNSNINILKPILSNAENSAIRIKKKEGPLDQQHLPPHERSPLTNVKVVEIIVGVHFGNMTYIDSIKEQKKIIELICKDRIPIKFAYYTSTDEKNSFISQNPSYNNYYHEAFNEKNFKKLVKVLKARANKEEINYFNSKKKLSEVINIFLPITIDCYGIITLKNEGIDIKEYEKEAFGSLYLRNFLKNFWDKKKIDDKLKSSIDSLQKRDFNVDELKQNILALKECSGYSDFVDKFNKIMPYIRLF
jgi:hypothetical protein